MHIYFSGVGGTAIGPLAMITHQAGYDVSGSDKQDSQYIEYLKTHGIEDIHIGQAYDQILAVHERMPIDWLVYSSAVAIENPDAPELQFCRDHGIKATKRDELINQIIADKQLKLIAVAGTHGKTTTTAMAVWLLKQLNIPVSFSVGAKTSFGEMGEYVPGSEYFVYEADEFDRNFLHYHPHLSLITGVDWDHPDVFPTRDDYNQAFRDFLDQSNHSVVWQEDAARLGIASSNMVTVITKADYADQLHLPGVVNREDAALVAQGMLQLLGGDDAARLYKLLDAFPGVSRRFEQLVPNLYTDYAHTPAKIRGAMQLAYEVAGDNVVVVYEGLHNTRQHFIKDELAHLFDLVKHVYIVPSYRAREDENLEDLTPEKLTKLLSKPAAATPSQLDDNLRTAIQKHLDNNELVLCLSAGGGGSLDEWLRKNFS